jgi:DNA modification methylase
VSGANFLDGRVTLLAGDCLEILAALPESSVDSVVTDPPYHLTSIVKRFGKDGSAPAQFGTDGAYARASSGFMGKQWDGGDIAFRVELWAQVLRVLRPGGHLVAFSGTRTYHRMACAIEDAGFEIRDQIGWAYGSGFPKSHDVSKGIDKAAGVEREVVGSKLGLPGYSNAATEPNNVYGDGFGNAAGSKVSDITAPATDAAKQWQGWGTALKPAWEPICLARKPLIGTVAANVLEHGVGALNIDGCRVETDEVKPKDAIRAAYSDFGTFEERGGSARSSGSGANHNLGRWPANLIHDGSEDVIAAFPMSGPPCGSAKKGDSQGWIAGSPAAQAGSNAAYVGDTGSAARFFYTAKADAEDRLGSKHPTVKPLDLMQWLVRLVTPKGGMVLDPFAGTGTTGEAAWREGCRAILIEREAEYQADIARRMELAVNPTKRAAVAKTKNQLDNPADLPLFREPAE